MINWSLESRKINALDPYEKNPRYITKEDLRQLQTSISKFGLIDKPIINLDNTIIGGHQRIYALKESGEKTVDCWVPDRMLDEKEVEECNIRLNKNQGDWDYEVLANEWETEELIQWGFTCKELEIADPIEEVEAKEPEEEEKDTTIQCPKCNWEFVK